MPHKYAHGVGDGYWLQMRVWGIVPLCLTDLPATEQTP